MVKRMMSPVAITIIAAILIGLAFIAGLIIGRGNEDGIRQCYQQETETRQSLERRIRQAKLWLEGKAE